MMICVYGLSFKSHTPSLRVSLKLSLIMLRNPVNLCKKKCQNLLPTH